MWWSEVEWFGQTVVFQTDYDEIDLKRKSVMTLFKWCHCYYVSVKLHQTNVTSTTFSIFFLPQSKLRSVVEDWLFFLFNLWPRVRGVGRLLDLSDRVEHSRGRSNILILPKSNYFCRNFALILPKFSPNPNKSSHNITNFAQKVVAKGCGCIPSSYYNGVE